MTFIQAVSVRLQELLEEKDMKPYGLSMASGVSQTTIGDIKYLRNKSVSTKILYDLCQGLGIEIAEFFDQFAEVAVWIP